MIYCCRLLNGRVGATGTVRESVFIDNVPLRVCHNKHIHSHKVLDGLAAREHGSMASNFGTVPESMIYNFFKKNKLA
ncbi:MAG: hypothetical protein GDA42_11945 [Ekhidna sp.]|nr:hypothetical protein [Ekhidna sp.]